ncbi:uncharacterized protein [Dermacentor albipictus]|uniref:uncharacterized protein n=1 Tax=Dermacentor albipictus TaxID=60249 RepID=UPI0031FCFF56
MSKLRHPKGLPSEDEDSGRGSVDSGLICHDSPEPGAREGWLSDVASASLPDEEQPWLSGVSPDYDNVASPGGSSTASGPVYVRTPGFEHHGHSVTATAAASGAVTGPGVSEKKAAAKGGNKSTGLRKGSVISVNDVSALNEGRSVATRVRAKPKKEPLPMKLRALPQSFWQQPDETSGVSPAIVMPVLPPLFKHDTQEDLTAVRPLTPPEGSGERRPRSPERVVRVKNTELLMRLFDEVDPERRPMAPVVKRGRPKKPPPAAMSRSLRGDDPCMVNAATEALLPLLPFGSRAAGGQRGQPGNSMAAALAAHHQQHPPTVTMVTLKDGDKTVSLPSLTVDHNYPQVLSELVMRL